MWNKRIIIYLLITYIITEGLYELITDWVVSFTT